MLSGFPFTPISHQIRNSEMRCDWKNIDVTLVMIAKDLAFSIPPTPILTHPTGNQLAPQIVVVNDKVGVDLKMCNILTLEFVVSMNLRRKTDCILPTPPKLIG